MANRNCVGGDKKCKKDKQKAILKWNRNKFEPRRTRAKHNCDKHKNLMNQEMNQHKTDLTRGFHGKFSLKIVALQLVTPTSNHLYL